MTDEAESTRNTDQSQALSLFPEPDLGLRVRPSEFARMCQVSRQTVSRWVQEGKIQLGPDGRLDPKKAASQVVNNTDPTRLRAKVLRPLVDDAATLRQQIRELTKDRDTWKALAERQGEELDQLKFANGLQADHIAWLEQFAPPDHHDEEDEEQ